nr:MAG TPA: type I neck protein [Caudoviricetes sp.]
MKVEFVIHKDGVKDLLKSQEVQNLLATKAAGIAARAGDGFTSGVRVGTDRARAYVLPETYVARRRQAKHHLLERAVGKG